MVSELLADLACTYDVLPDLAEMRDKSEGPWSPEILEKDERRLAEFERTREGVPWEDVESWMRTWRTSNEFPANPSEDSYHWSTTVVAQGGGYP